MNIICYSGGKDSGATAVLCHKYGIHIDEIVFSEVMFDKDISGELPEHINFIKEVAFPIFESWGYKTRIVRADKTYMDCFEHVLTRSKNPERNGKRAGFPMGGKCGINRDCKVGPIRKYLKEARAKGEVIEFVGIAADEPVRLARLKKNQRSILAEHDITEEEAFEIVKEHNLLSPVYEYTKRGVVGFA